ncbi:hypothetical protein HOI71_14535 [Candidatus Poribacteria bacterium]|nr:hypothetical protein [Candidatus Poribacteria bacterium]
MGRSAGNAITCHEHRSAVGLVADGGYDGALTGVGGDERVNEETGRG